MEEARESDLLKTQMDLVDLTSMERTENDNLSIDSLENREEEEEEESINPAASTNNINQKGYCVKEFEQKLETLEKENFNLRLRIYYLEENNPNAPKKDEEQLFKEIIDLKIQNESLLKDLDLKQDLLCQASKAMEMLEDAKHEDEHNSEKIIFEMDDKIKTLQEEIISLQNALADQNKSHLGNDTAYNEFIGAAVDAKDIEIQRIKMEMDQQSEGFHHKFEKMMHDMKVLESTKNELKKKTANLQYERDELIDKLNKTEAQANETTSQLEKDLYDFKDKWASTQCDLHDAELKIKETEDEHERAIKMLQKALQTLEEERRKIIMLETAIRDRQHHSPTTFDNNITKKEAEIAELKEALTSAQEKLQITTTSELSDKNKEIERLTNIVNSMKQDKLPTQPPRFSIEHLFESFNELKFQQVLQIKKESQQKIDHLVNEIVKLSNVKTQEYIQQLKEQLAIVIEKQQYTDAALGQCTELCSFTLEHLHELAQFLSAIMKNKEIRESLGNFNLLALQELIDRSLDISQRNSIDGRLSILADLSSIDIFLTSARESMLNVRENKIDNKVDQYVQAEISCEKCIELNAKLTTLKDEIMTVNQVANDNRGKIQALEGTVKNYEIELQTLQEREEEVNKLNEESQKTIQSLQVDKINISDQFEKSEILVQKLQSRLKEIEDDLMENWVTKSTHDQDRKKLQDEIVNAEAQVAAIRMELDLMSEQVHESKRKSAEFKQIKEDIERGLVADLENRMVEISDNAASSNFDSDDMKENVEFITASSINYENTQESTMNTRRTIEISDDRKQLLMASDTTLSCEKCPKYKARMYELSRHLKRAIDKLHKQSEQKALIDLHIQKQLNRTESFLQQARFNMDNIVAKTKEGMNKE